MTEQPDYPTPWGMAAADQILNTSTLRTAVTLAASHLSTLLDDLIPVMEPDGLLETQYRHFCYLRRATCQSDGSDFMDEYRWMWGCAEEIFSVYERLPQISDLEVELHTLERFAPDYDAEIEREDAVRSVFTYVLAYMEGMRDSQIADKSTRELHQLTFKGPGFDIESYLPCHWSWIVPPEPDYSLGEEDYRLWMDGK